MAGNESKVGCDKGKSERVSGLEFEGEIRHSK